MAVYPEFFITQYQGFRLMIMLAQIHKIKEALLAIYGTMIKDAGVELLYEICNNKLTPR